MKYLNIFALLFIFTVSAVSAQTMWKFDKSHTNIGFSVTHMVISDVEGFFKVYDGSVESDGDDFSGAKVNFTIEVNSVSTENTARDKHLRSDDFFNAEKFPTITFAGKDLKQVEGNNWKLTGNLTMRDVTKEVEFDVKFNGTIVDPWGNTRAGFKVTGEVNRFDYGLKWSKVMEAGGLVVGETVEITANIELIKEAK